MTDLCTGMPLNFSASISDKNQKTFLHHSFGKGRSFCLQNRSLSVIGRYGDLVKANAGLAVHYVLYRNSRGIVQ